jgi:hypothetical protein
MRCYRVELDEYALRWNILLHPAGRLQHDTKRSTSTTPQSPEKIRVLTCVGGAEQAVGCNNLELQDAVNPQPQGVGQYAVSAALDPTTCSPNSLIRPTEESEVVGFSKFV